MLCRSRVVHRLLEIVSGSHSNRFFTQLNSWGGVHALRRYMLTKKCRMAGGGCVFIGVMWSIGALAASDHLKPYDSIAGRNLFNLHPAPSTDVVVTSKPPLPMITLTGITTILGKKVAFLTVSGGKPGQPSGFWMLAEGQVQNDVMVERIDERAGMVRVLNHGEMEVLGFGPDGGKAFGVGLGRIYSFCAT